jgi:N-acetylneuraminic acid mutarotase
MNQRHATQHLPSPTTSDLYGRRLVRTIALLISGVVAFATFTPVTAQAASMGWTSAASTSIAHFGGAAAAGPDGRLYVIGSASNPTSVEAYTPSSNSWSNVSPLAHGRYDVGAAKGGDGRIYAIGGYDDGCGCYSAETNAYNTGTNTWTTVAALPLARIYTAAASAPDGRVFAIGGYASGGITNRVDIYTPSTNRWTAGTAMPTPRYGAAAVTGSDGNIYVIGGYQTGVRVLKTVEMYNPTANTWTTKAAMPTGRYLLAGGLGSDGRIYAIGGTNDTTTYMATVEAYDPTLNTWASAVAMPTARYGLSAAALGGKVYAVGGRAAGGDSKAAQYLSGTAGPSGTVSINGGAATTNSLTVSLDVPATGSASITNVAISNSGATSGGQLSTSRLFTYQTPVAWDLSDAVTGGTGATGVHTVYAQWKDADGTWSAVSSDSIDYETAPVPQPVTNLQADTSVTGQVTLSWTNPGALAGDIVRRDVSAICPASASDGSAVGNTSVRTSQLDAAGTPGTEYCWSVFTTNGSTNSAVTSVIATVPAGGGGGTGPVISGINNRLTYSTVTGGKVPVQTTWVGTDSDDTIASYEAQMKTNAGAWTNVTLASPTDTSLTVSLAPGNTYNFQIRGTDAHGNVGTWTPGTAFILKGFQQTAASFTGVWKKQTLAGSWGGSVSWSKTVGASASITFTGRNLALVGTKGPGYGSADVYVDGVLWKTIDCKSATTSKALILFRYSTELLTNQTHTVMIVNKATVGHPRFDIDGFLSFQST